MRTVPRNPRTNLSVWCTSMDERDPTAGVKGKKTKPSILWRVAKLDTHSWTVWCRNMKAFCVHQEKCFGSDLSSALLQMIDLYIYIVWFNIWYIEKHNNSSSLQTESVISCAVRSGAAARRGNRDISESLNAVLGTKTRMFKYEIKHCRLFNEKLWD